MPTPSHALAGLLLVLPAIGVAATKTATFNVTAAIISDCSIVASDLAFGNVGTTTPVDATSTISVTCTPSTVYTIGLDGGTAAGSTIADRRMASSGNSLQYQMYQDAPRTLLWGNTPPTDTAGGTGTGVAQTLTVYGRVPTQTIPAVGSYSSTVTATITY